MEEIDGSVMGDLLDGFNFQPLSNELHLDMNLDGTACLICDGELVVRLCSFVMRAGYILCVPIKDKRFPFKVGEVRAPYVASSST